MTDTQSPTPAPQPSTSVATPAAQIPSAATETRADAAAGLEHQHSNVERRAAAELVRLRRLIRAQFLDAVQDESLDLELANGMLAVFGMQPVPQRFVVRLNVAVRCEVSGGGEDDAYETAARQIEEALTAHELPLQLLWDSLERLDARADGIDSTALDD